MPSGSWPSALPGAGLAVTAASKRAWICLSNAANPALSNAWKELLSDLHGKRDYADYIRLPKPALIGRTHWADGAIPI